MDKQILYNNLDYWADLFQKKDLLNRPSIDFLLEDEDSQIVGAAEQNDHGQNYIYEEKNNDLYHYDDIDVEDDVYGYEAYIIYCLCHGFEIRYISIQTHFILWYYINEYMEELKDNPGVVKYLKYCLETGINGIFISYYASYEMEDLIKAFLFS